MGSTALSALSLAVLHAAYAQPPANSLPGPFSSNQGVTYTGTSSIAATITTVGGANNVLQWGGTALPNSINPTGNSFTTNPGFSIGSGATLNISGAATSVLVSDLTGSASQIFGTLTASSLGAGVPLFVSNANGVIVGSTGTINAPTGGVGLLGYAVDPTAFASTGTVTVSNSTPGTGNVTIMSGAAINGGDLLVASNGTVNIGATAPVTNYTFVMAGFGFTTGPGGSGMVAPQAAPNPPTTLTTGASSVVNFTPAAANALLTVDQLDAAGAVNNSGNLGLFADGPSQDLVLGLFTNSGTLTDESSGGDFGNNQLAGGLTNTGTINASPAAGNLVIESNGNVQNKGVLNLAAAGEQLFIEAANIDLEGSVLADSTALSPNNPIGGLVLVTLGANGTVANPGIPATAGVIDLATSIFTNDANTITLQNSTVPLSAYIAGNAIRVLPNGNVFATAGNIGLFPGTNAAGVADPFYNIPALGYTFSLFGGTWVQATTGNIYLENLNGGTQSSNSSGLNLLGTLATLSSTSSINVVANNINANNGLNGGFSVPDGGTINLIFFGNVNNPNGAAAHGSTAFQYNYIPVTVGPAGNKVGAGTANITLAGPSYSSARDQNVNLLVHGNVQLADGSGADALFPSFQDTAPLTAPSPLPTPVLSSYANNHLVVTATGNIGLNPSQAAGLADPNIFYWPGMVYLTSGATATNPTAAPNSNASIVLGNTSTSVSLSNLIPADLTTADVGGQIGGGGVHYVTNILNIGTSTTTTSNNSWVNFLTTTQASGFQMNSGAQFLGGTISGGTVSTQQLPAGDFQPQ